MVSQPAVELNDGLRPDNRVLPTTSISRDSMIEPNISNEDSISPQDPGDEPWTTVRRQRARSFESLEPVRIHTGSRRDQGLTVDQVQAVKAATEAMSQSQKEVLQKRQKKVTHQREESSSSRGEGASRPKGKGIDPREWGNLNVSQESLDIEAQAAAWRSLTQGNKASQKKNDKTGKGTHHSHRTNYRSPSARLPAASRPVAQLAQDSYLGLTLRNVGRSNQEGPVPGEEGDSPSSSEPSSSEERSDSESSSSDNENPHHGRSKRRKRKSSRKSIIKPIAPTEYDGCADPRAYHRFVRESEAYLRDGRVKGSRKIFLLSYYLTGKAYDFYTQKVANDEGNWTLPQFYDELFNYSFPVDYRMQLRRKLARCHQNEKSVAEYIHELDELFNMIGNIPERDQVLKFWNGSRPVIQKGLWRDNLNPETSSWARVVAQAEIIEISENVAERRDRRGGVPSKEGSYGGPNAGPSKSRSRAVEQSVRSVSFDNRAHQSRTESRTSHRSEHRSDNRSHSSRGRENSHHSHSSNPPRGSMSSRGRSSTPRGPTNSSRSTPRLSDKEKADRKVAGLCFVCGGADHFSRDCPTKRVVKSSGDKPPGASSFNIEPTVSEEDSDGVEVLDSLPVGSILVNCNWDEGIPGLTNEESDDEEGAFFWPLDQWREHYPYWDQPNVEARRMIGDCYAAIADSILTLSQPYPGDEQYPWNGLHPELRFLFRKKGLLYQIVDNLVDERVEVDADLLKRQHFNISHWYAVRRVKALSLNKRSIRPYISEMGPAVSIIARKLLTDGIHTYYPCVRPNLDPNSRFAVCQRGIVRNEYLITDKDLQTHVAVPRSLLEDHTFDLVGWYIQYLSQLDLYKSDWPRNRCCATRHSYTGCSRDHPDTAYSTSAPVEEPIEPTDASGHFPR